MKQTPFMGTEMTEKNLDYLKEFFNIDKADILEELIPNQDEEDKNEKYFRMVKQKSTEYGVNLRIEQSNPTYRRCVNQPTESIWERKWEDRKDFIVVRGGIQPKLEHFDYPVKAFRFAKFKDALIFTMVRTKYQLRVAVDHIYPLADIPKGEKIWKLCKEKDPLLPYFKNKSKDSQINAEWSRGYIISTKEIKKNQPIFI